MAYERAQLSTLLGRLDEAPERLTLIGVRVIDVARPA